MGGGPRLIIPGATSAGTAPVFTPASLSGLDFWFNPKNAASVTTSAGVITKITDQSPNAWAGMPGSGFTGPTYQANYRNGNSVMKFTGTQNIDFAGQTPFVNSGQGFHLFFFINSGDFSLSAFTRFFNLSENAGLGAQGYHAFYSNDPSYTGLNFGVTGTFNGCIGAAAPIATDNILEISWNGVSQVYNSGSYFLAFNGGASSPITANGGQTPQTINNSLGSPDPEGFAALNNGVLGDCIKYNRVLSAPERLQVINYLKTAWNL